MNEMNNFKTQLVDVATSIKKELEFFQETDFKV